MHGPERADQSTTDRHIPALDGIRGLAILLVLGDHLLWSNPDPGGPWIRLLASLHAAGWIGVDLFFVLSGFLITGILYDSLGERHYFRNFYARRALRIFPLFYGFFLVVFLLSHFNGWHWYPAAFRYLTYTQVLTPSSIGPATDAWWIGLNPLWSLAIEEQFYLLWPTLVFALRSRRLIVLFALAGALASLLLRVYVRHSNLVIINPYAIYSWTPARLDGLFLGASLAIAIRSRFREAALRFCRPVLSVGLCALALFYLRYPGLHVPYYLAVAEWVPAILAVTFAALVTATLRPASAIQRSFTQPLLRFFGRYSYGLYVFHATVGAFTFPLRPYLQHRLHSKGLGVLLEAGVTLAVTIVLALLSFHLFEKQCLRLKKYFQDVAPGPKLHDFVRDGQALPMYPETTHPAL